MPIIPDPKENPVIASPYTADGIFVVAPDGFVVSVADFPHEAEDAARLLTRAASAPRLTAEVEADFAEAMDLVVPIREYLRGLTDPRLSFSRSMTVAEVRTRIREATARQRAVLTPVNVDALDAREIARDVR